MRQQVYPMSRKGDLKYMNFQCCPGTDQQVNDLTWDKEITCTDDTWS